MKKAREKNDRKIEKMTRKRENNEKIPERDITMKIKKNEKDKKERGKEKQGEGRRKALRRSK